MRMNSLWQRRMMLGLILLGLTGLWACASPQKQAPESIADSEASLLPPQVHVYRDFVVVTTTAEDTLASLADHYLHDPGKAWIIAEFNGVATVTAGTELLIPLKPIVDGGLSHEGYQVVPVLLYHDFSKNRPGKMRVTEKSFEEQMRFLKENDYHVITLMQFLDFIDLKADIPEKSVVITIDDGWRSLYTIAYPILKKYNFPVTLFVYTDFPGGSKALSWDQIRELSQNGFDIQCHTMSHRYLTKMNKGEPFDDFFQSIDKEIVYSKTVLKKKLGIECDCLAYPYGRTNSLVVALIKKQGYRAAFTVTRGSNAFYVNPYMIKRSVIYGRYDLEKFKRNLKVIEKMELP